MKGKRGFSLVEIMIATSIVALISALAIPNLLRSRMNASEALVMDSCHTIAVACQNFYSANQPHAYPATLQELAEASPPYLDPVLGGGQKQGYRFTYQSNAPDTFSLNADPVIPGWNGNRHFYMDETGVLRVRFDAAAGPNDVPALAY